MVIDHSHRLHEGVTNRRTDEFESAPFQIPAHGVGLPGACRNLLHVPAPVPDRLATGELPDIPVEAAELLLDLQKRLGIENGSANFEAIPDDSRVLQEPPNLGDVVARDFTRIEVVVDLAV